MTVKAMWNGQLLAESDQTIIIEGNHYFPPESVTPDVLVDSETHSICSWKGTASYYSVNAGGQTNIDAAWFYPEPMDAAKEIAGYVAFWKGVTVA
jgi:uncharacterized protein (DUF427 family)